MEQRQAERRTNATGMRQEQRRTEMGARHRSAGRYYGHGLAYRMGEERRHSWRHAQAWRYRHHHWRYARAWRSDWEAEQLNAQELGAPRPTTTTTTQYYGSSGPAMAYQPSAGFEGPAPAPAPIGYEAGTVLWYPPSSNPPSPPGFPPPFWFW